MADSLFLNLWFPSFATDEMLPRLACLLRQFPFSQSRPGIGYIGVHSVNWNEPIVFQQTFDYRATPDEAIRMAQEFLHRDNGYIFEVMWDLWSAEPGSDHWQRRSHLVKFIVHGEEFDEEVGAESGNIQVDLGLDSNFLVEQVDLKPPTEARLRQNIEQLVDFTSAIEKHCGTRARLLWSESEENLAQKLIARLQRLQ